MKGYLRKTTENPGKNNAHNLKFLKTSIFLISMTLILTSLASAQVEFRDSNGFDFYNELGLYSDLSVEDGNISMNNNRILGLPEPTSSGEPLTQGSGSGDYVDRTGDSMSGDLDLQDNFLLGDNGEIDFSSGELLLNQQMPDSGSPTTLQINQDGTPKWALVSMQDGGLGIYDVQSDNIVAEFNENGEIDYGEDLDLESNNIKRANEIDFSGTGVGVLNMENGQIDIRDSGGDNTARFYDTGGVEIPNGNLDLGSNELKDVSDISGVSYIVPDNGVQVSGDTTVTDNLNVDGETELNDMTVFGTVLSDGSDTLVLERSSGEASIKSENGDVVIDSSGSGDVVALNEYTSDDVDLADGGGDVQIRGSSLQLNGNNIRDVNNLNMDGNNAQLKNIENMQTDGDALVLDRGGLYIDDGGLGFSGTNNNGNTKNDGYVDGVSVLDGDGSIVVVKGGLRVEGDKLDVRGGDVQLNGNSVTGGPGAGTTIMGPRRGDGETGTTSCPGDMRLIQVGTGQDDAPEGKQGVQLFGVRSNADPDINVVNRNAASVEWEVAATNDGDSDASLPIYCAY
jgi:hypothetical protein